MPIKSTKSRRKVARNTAKPVVTNPENIEDNTKIGNGESEPEPIVIRDETKLELVCPCCGKKKKGTAFYTNRASYVFIGNYNHVAVCKECIDLLYKRYYQLNGDALASAAAVLAIADYPYNEAVVHTCIMDGVFSFSLYARTCNLHAMSKKTFYNSILDGNFFDAKDKLKTNVEKLWSTQDKQNKKFCIEKLGYDPFDQFNLEDADYRAAFNILAKYLEDESIVSDAHKTQSVVTMVVTIIQSNKVEALLTYQYKNINPDAEKIKTLTTTKKDLQATISKLAEDNNISSKWQKENKAGQTHLTSKMKEMASEDYWQSKPNMFDVRTSAAMRQMFDLSHQSIIAQLELDDSDYANMVKEQREMIKRLQEKCDNLEEENRNLMNRYLSETVDKDGK